MLSWGSDNECAHLWDFDFSQLCHCCCMKVLIIIIHSCDSQYLCMCERRLVWTLFFFCFLLEHTWKTIIKDVFHMTTDDLKGIVQPTSYCSKHVFSFLSSKVFMYVYIYEWMKCIVWPNLYSKYFILCSVEKKKLSTDCRYTNIDLEKHESDRIEMTKLFIYL